MAKWKIGSIALAGAALLAACANDTGSDAARRSGTANTQAELGTMTFDLSQGLSSGSVAICGSATSTSIALGGCIDNLTEVQGPAGNPSKDGYTGCPCFNFDGSTPIAATNLCPGQWNFQYYVYAASGCANDPVGSPGMGPVECTIADGSSDEINQTTGETIVPGYQVNELVCVSDTSKKVWEFTACSRFPTLDGSIGTGVGYSCDCGDSTCGCVPADLYAGCSAPATQDGLCVFECANQPWPDGWTPAP